MISLSDTPSKALSQEERARRLCPPRPVAVSPRLPLAASFPTRCRGPHSAIRNETPPHLIDPVAGS